MDVSSSATALPTSNGGQSFRSPELDVQFILRRSATFDAVANSWRFVYALRLNPSAEATSLASSLHHGFVSAGGQGAQFIWPDRLEAIEALPRAVARFE